MIEIRPYNSTHDDGIRELCRIPVSGNISIALEREVNYYQGAEVQCRQPEIYVVLDSEEVIGVFNIGTRLVWLNGRKTYVRYLCDLRITPRWQTGHIFLRILKFYKALAKDECLAAQTIVFRDNLLMHQLIEKRKTKPVDFPVPYYHIQGTLVTSLLEPRSIKNKPTTYSVRRAEFSDIAHLQAFIDHESRKISYFPVYKLSDLGDAYYRDLNISDFFICSDGDQIVGTCFVWNQKRYKQTRITNYSVFYRWIRPAYNLLAKATKRSTLPPANSVLEYATLGSILVKERNTSIFSTILDHVLGDAAYASLHYLMCSLDERDPIYGACASYSKKRTTYGHYFLVDFDPEDKSKVTDYFYLEAARI